MSDKIALITGATDGIGKATARRLLCAGWQVVLVGRSEARCQAAVAELAAAAPGGKVSSLRCDLGSMADIAEVMGRFRREHDRLDLLLLNANSITQTFTRTPEGFESNFAIGFLGRALTALLLADLLEKTEGAQILTVVGLNLERIAFDDPSTERGFSSMKALGRWQWAMQVFTRAWNRRSTVPMNVYMPGLVKTKILADEPQPMRLVVQIANLLVGVPVDRAGEELAFVVDDIRKNRRVDGYYARKKLKPARDLKEQPDDGAQIWALAARMLAPWLDRRA